MERREGRERRERKWVQGGEGVRGGNENKGQFHNT